jgi:hypothetical protein
MTSLKFSVVPHSLPEMFKNNPIVKKYIYIFTTILIFTAAGVLLLTLFRVTCKLEMLLISNFHDNRRGS